MLPSFFLGIDVGSTTIKLVLLDKNGDLLHARYQRHLSDIRNTLADMTGDLASRWPHLSVSAAFSGSGAINLAASFQMPFIQEVVASTASIQHFLPQTDIAIELGGEDAKITFFDRGIEQRMNETCAGGTGAFIDQMASYLQTDAEGLNTLAERYQTIYPIASRCGVFAKTDIMPLLNEGAAKEDIAASIFQAVVDQTIGGLACGRSIQGNIALLGGPLYFLPELRKRFQESLNLKDGKFLFPQNAHYFVALGAAFEAQRLVALTPEQGNATNISLQCLAARTKKLVDEKFIESPSLPPLFASPEELGAFTARHKKFRTARIDPQNYSGAAFLGIDAGSTTMKAVLIDQEGNLLFSAYGHNLAAPLETAKTVLKQARECLGPAARIMASGTTGYGSGLLRTAFGIDIEEVETIAHYTAARHLCPDVSFLLDIGGQDMKCLHADNGHIDSIMLNEACSAGCGVFIETFAQSLDIDMRTFVQAALTAPRPMDLGSRCTVFMNSKVKQAQKEGASVGNIAAGLAYSIVRNALYKVIKTPSIEKLGPVVVVQGGAFRNDALLRAFELLLGREVIRPDIAELMGAYGVALIARDRFPTGKNTGLITPQALDNFTSTSTSARCKGCGNNCRLTINRFNSGGIHVSGNRCERGARANGAPAKPHTFAPNLFRWKNTLLFRRPVLPLDQAPRGQIGIPRALNIFENYPYWHAFFTYLGFRVELSSPSSSRIFALGQATIPSQTICYPAKMAHGHIMDLINRGIKKIFFPCVVYEQHEFADAVNNYNCPVVTSYPEILRLNLDALSRTETTLSTPFLGLSDRKKFLSELKVALDKLFPDFHLTRREIEDADQVGKTAMERYKATVRRAGEGILDRVRKKKGIAIVLAGHPYHVDPAVHHGIPDMIAEAGVPVLTEDAVAHLGLLAQPLRVVDQWSYHARLYRSAALVGVQENLGFIQLTSFGCGLDAVTADQCMEILRNAGKNSTLLKIDEGTNLGAARIRVRSILATLKEKKFSPTPPLKKYPLWRPVPFTRRMKDSYTILIPQFSPIHFRFLESSFAQEGYHVRLLPAITSKTVETGLKYVNNDACYPALIVIGQLLEALLSGMVDPDHTALMISQTGGGCRATNYIGFLRKALMDAGLGHVPVVPFSLAGREKNSGFVLTRAMGKRIIRGMLYGDLLSRLFYRTRPYEKQKGEATALLDETAALAATHINDGRHFSLVAEEITAAFASIPRYETPRPKVGMVGEILLKYHTGANNHAADIIEAEGGEAVPTDLANFFLYSLQNRIYTACHLKSAPLFATAKNHFLLWWIEKLRDEIRAVLKQYPYFGTMPKIDHLGRLASNIIGLGHQTGEGWLLTGEMVSLLEEGVSNILCMQPFACLPNHSTGKGVIRELKRRYPLANITPIDYDPGTSEVNQLNRIKLMMAVAFRNFASV